MLTLWMLQVLMAMTLSGYAGSHFSYGGWNSRSVTYAVGLGSLGLKAEPNDWATASVRFLYFDLLRGSDSTSSYQPYLQEAWVQGQFTPRFAIRIGHQIFSYRDGLFLHDIGDGSDALRLRWGVVDEGTPGLDLFVLRKGAKAFESGRQDRDLLGFYGTLNWGTQIFDLYGAYGTYTPWPRWLGGRADLRLSSRCLTVLEAVVVRPVSGPSGFAIQAYLRIHDLWTRGTILGTGLYGFSRNWQKPVSYPLILDSYYNGWTAFGEAMNWVVLPTVLAPYLSSTSTSDPYAVYWPDLHNLWVANMYFYWPFHWASSVRLDYFLYRFDDPPLDAGNSAMIGQEFTINLYRQTGLATLGVSAGLFLPLSATKTLGWSQPAWNLRVWGFLPFEVEIPERME